MFEGSVCFLLRGEEGGLREEGGEGGGEEDWCLLRRPYFESVGERLWRWRSRLLCSGVEVEDEREKKRGEEEEGRVKQTRNGRTTQPFSLSYTTL